MKNLKDLKTAHAGLNNETYTKLAAGIKINDLLKKLPGYKIELGERITSNDILSHLPDKDTRKHWFHIDTICKLTEWQMNDAKEWQIIHISHEYGSYKLSIPCIEPIYSLYLHELGIQQNKSEGIGYITFTAAVIKQIKRSIPFASKDKWRPNVTGILIEVLPNMQCNIIATDCNKLIYNTQPLNIFTSEGEGQYIIPIEAASIIAKQKGECTLTIQSGNKFTVNGIRFAFIDARFPDYKCVIPTEYKDSVLLPADAFINCLNQVLPMANDTTYMIKAHFNGQIDLSAEDIDLHKEGTAKLPYLSKVGEDLTIAFNGKWMAQIVKSFNDCAVNMMHGGSKDKCMVLHDQDDTQRVLLMPLCME